MCPPVARWALCGYWRGVIDRRGVAPSGRVEAGWLRNRNSRYLSPAISTVLSSNKYVFFSGFTIFNYKFIVGQLDKLSGENHISQLIAKGI